MATFVIGLIVLASVFGVWFQAKAWLGYRAELGLLDRAQIAMRAMDVGEKIDALISRCAVSERSIVGHRIYQIKGIADSPAPPSVADLSAADFERDDSRWESVFPNTLISILLITGLAGTLVSFKNIIGDFPVESKTTVEITKWMNTAYPAFGTAFFASLYGIGGTVLLLIVRSAVHNQRAELFDRLDRFTAAPLYPRFVEQKASDAKTLVLAGQQLLETAASFKQSVAKMEALPDAMTSAASDIRDAAIQARASLKSATATFADFKTTFEEGGDARESLHQLKRSVTAFARQTEAATGTLRDAVAGATEALRGAAKSVKEAGDSMASVGAEVAAANRNIEQCVKQLLDGNTAHAAKMDACILSVGEIVETSSRNQREWGEAISPAIRAMTESAGKIGKSVGALDLCTDALVTAVDRIEKSCGVFASAGDLQVKRFEATADKIDQAIRQSNDSQREFLEKSTAQLVSAGDAQAKRMDTSAAKIDRGTEQTLTSHREFLKGLEPVLKDLPSQLLDSAQQQAKLLAQLTVIGTELRAEIARLGLRSASARRGPLRWLKFWGK